MPTYRIQCLEQGRGDEEVVKRGMLRDPLVGSVSWQVIPLISWHQGRIQSSGYWDPFVR